MAELKWLINWWNYFYFGSAPIHATGITLNKNSITLTTAWQQEQLTATVTPEGAIETDIFWTSNNTSIATVSNTGLVTCVTPWQCTITASTSNGISASCSVWNAKYINYLLVWWWGWGWWGPGQWGGGDWYCSGSWWWGWEVIYSECYGFTISSFNISIWAWWWPHLDWCNTIVSWTWIENIIARWWKQWDNPKWQWWASWSWCIWWWYYYYSSVHAWWWGWWATWNWWGWWWCVWGNWWTWLCWYWWWGWWYNGSSCWAWCDWWWNASYCRPWNDATNYWWWWGAASGGINWVTWWCWYQWMVEICYPTDWSYGITSATWGDCCYTCNGYCVHRFTSNGTFCVVG